MEITAKQAREFIKNTPPINDINQSVETVIKLAVLNRQSNVLAKSEWLTIPVMANLMKRGFTVKKVYTSEPEATSEGNYLISW